MVEFLQSIIDWVVINKDEILLFFTSGQFAALITSLVVLVKQLKANSGINSTNKELKVSLDEANAKITDMLVVKESSNNASKDVAKMKAEVAEFKTEVEDSFDTILKKMNAILEVQSLVYSTVKDEHLRTMIASILTDAKFIETATRAELESQIEALKEQIKEKVAVIQDTVDDATTKVKKMATTHTTTNTVSRY